MGASSGVGKSINTRRGRRGSRHGAISEINVTPLVDVMLVLLIVFMVAAPLMTVSVPVDLPKINSQPAPNPTEPLFITVKDAQTLYLQEEQMPREQLLTKLAAIAKQGLNENVMVRADKGVPYGDILVVLGDLSSAGYTKVGLAGVPLDGPVPGNGK
jgi:biopolymer transport protein TolR